MKLYFIRHGESENNLRHLYTGACVRVSLTDLGESQAKSVGERLLRGIKFDKIYSSDLVRAMQTTEFALPGCEYTTDPRLREIDVGDLEGITVAEGTERYGEIHLEARQKSDYTPFGGESYDMLSARARSFVEEVSRTDAECVAVFSHGGFIRAVLGLVLGDIGRIISVSIPNCSVMVVEVKDEKLRLLSWNLCDESLMHN